jgi:non-canonical (house-cleaning) NTP pyrophosphatase
MTKALRFILAAINPLFDTALEDTLVNWFGNREFKLDVHGCTSDIPKPKTLASGYEDARVLAQQCISRKGADYGAGIRYCFFNDEGKWYYTICVVLVNKQGQMGKSHTSPIEVTQSAYTHVQYEHQSLTEVTRARHAHLRPYDEPGYYGLATMTAIGEIELVSAAITCALAALAFHDPKMRRPLEH